MISIPLTNFRCSRCGGADSNCPVCHELTTEEKREARVQELRDLRRRRSQRKRPIA